MEKCKYCKAETEEENEIICDGCYQEMYINGELN